MRGSCCLPLAYFGHQCSQRKRSIMPSACLQYREVVRIILFANRRSAPLPSPPLFLKSIHACNNNESYHRFSVREGCADHFACKWGSAPQPPRFFQAVHACNKQEASCHHQVCSSGKVVQIILFANAGATHRPNSPVFESRACLIMFATASCHQYFCSNGRQIILFADGRGQPPQSL